MNLNTIKTQTELLTYLKQQPSAVQISGTRHQVCLSFQGLILYFPVVDHIYTRWICRLQDVQIEASDDWNPHLNPQLIEAMVQAATCRPHSSFDLEFKE